MKTPMPLPGGASGSVRANTMNASAAGALVMYRLSPSMTQPLVVPPRGGDQPARIGPGVGLGQGEGGDDLAGGQPRQPLLALFLGAARTRTCPAIPLFVPNRDRNAGQV